MTPTAVLFDMDGTLVDSRPGIVGALNATLRELGEPERSDAELVPRIGPPIQETWAWLLDRPIADVGDVVAAYRERYATHMLDGSHVYPGVAKLLEQLDGQLLAVATSKSQHLAVALLEHLGLDHHFAAIRGPIPPSTEPKAGTVARALEAIGLTTGAGAVLVGDRSHDIEGGHEHGLTVIGAAWGYASPGELDAADHVAAEPLGVLPLLTTLSPPPPAAPGTAPSAP